jgi:hypothetical protein
MNSEKVVPNWNQSRGNVLDFFDAAQIFGESVEEYLAHAGQNKNADPWEESASENKTNLLHGFFSSD